MSVPSYIWPDTLWRPEPRPKLVYLDLNHWTSLSRRLGASTGPFWMGARMS